MKTATITIATVLITMSAAHLPTAAAATLITTARASA